MKKKLLDEWIYKAEEDFKSAIHLVKKRKDIVPDVVCFHSQQCIEKYLKAVLVKNDIEPPAIHDLQRLGELSSNIDRDFQKIKMDLDVLNEYAINFRYPGEEANVEESREAVSVMKKLREFIRNKLKI